MMQLACSWLGKLVVGVHVRDAGGCMEEKLKGYRLKSSRRAVQEAGQMAGELSGACLSVTRMLPPEGD